MRGTRQAERRLRMLEQAANKRVNLGMRVFFEDFEQQGLYSERQGEGCRHYTREEVKAFSEQGWLVLTVHYEDNWRGGNYPEVESNARTQT